MRKSDGMIKILLDSEVVGYKMYEAVGKGPYSSFHFEATGDIKKGEARSSSYAYMSAEWHQPKPRISPGGEDESTLSETTSGLIGSCAVAVGIRDRFCGDYQNPGRFLHVIEYETPYWL